MHLLDSTTLGGVYLCQIDEEISCGACCGLYNVETPSHEYLETILDTRTNLFKNTSRTYDALTDFKHQVQTMESQKRPYPEFHHCPYLGLIGDKQKRPGCLLHPLGNGNNGVDHRGLSHWGGFACASYFCPTCSQLPKRYKKITRICAKNWHIFGLIVTETQMLKCFFEQIEIRLENEISPDFFLANSELRDSVNLFFQTKTTWKYRPKNFQELGNYFFKDNLYKRDQVPYSLWGAEPSPFDPIFTALGSFFQNADELNEAETELTRTITKIVNQLNSSRCQPGKTSAS